MEIFLNFIGHGWKKCDKLKINEGFHGIKLSQKPSIYDGSTDTYDVLKLSILRYIGIIFICSTDTYDVLKLVISLPAIARIISSTDTYDVLKYISL